MFALRATIIIQQWNRAQINRPEFTSSPLHHPLFSAKHLPRPKHLRLHLLHLIQRFYRPTFPSCDYFFFLLARACNPALFPDLICPLPRPSILLLSLSLSPSRTRVEHRHKEKKERENPRISSGDLSPRTLSRGRISPKRWYEFSGSRALLSFLSLYRRIRSFQLRGTIQARASKILEKNFEILGNARLDRLIGVYGW